MTDLRKLLSQNMKVRRKILKISQAELAEKAETATNYISKIEAMKQFPSVEMLERIALALKIDTVDLFHIETKREVKIQEIEDILVLNIQAEIHKQLAKVR